MNKRKYLISEEDQNTGNKVLSMLIRQLMEQGESEVSSILSSSFVVAQVLMATAIYKKRISREWEMKGTLHLN